MAEFDPDAYLAKKEKRGGFDPDAYLAKTQPAPQPETAMQTFGRSAASLADSALNAATGTLDWGAYALARSAGRTPEQAQAETTSPKDVVGRLFGVTGTPGYEQAPLRQLGGWVGETLGENVIQPTAQATGISEQDVGNMLNSLAMGVAPVAGRATAPIGRAVAATPKVIAAIPDVAKGAYGAATGKIAKPGVAPEVWQQPSSRVPVGPEFLPAEQLRAWRAGEISTPEAQANMRPSTELPAAALQSTQGNIPYAGQGARAFGEQLGEIYSNPLNLLTDIGLDVLTGSPIPTMARLGYKGYQAGKKAQGASELSKYGFSPLYPEELAALKSGAEHPSSLGNYSLATPTTSPVAGPVVPQLGYTPAGQTAMPMPGPGRRVNIEGETYNLPYQIDVANSQAARPQFNVGPTAEQLAVQQAAERAAISEANKLRVAQQIEQQRAQQAAPAVETSAPVAPVAEQPAPIVTTTPVAPIAETPTPVAQRPMTASEVRGKLPRRPGETGDEFEARVQEVLRARPMVDVETPTTPATPVKEKRKYTRQEDTLRELDAALTPEERAAQQATVERQLAKSRGTQVAGPVAPTEVISTESLKAKMATPEQTAMDDATRARLEALMNKKKTPPPGAMEMITDSPDAITKIKNAEWLTGEDFAQQSFMHDLGLNPGKDFIAKTKTENGSIIRAVDSGIDSTAAQFPDGTGYLIRKHLKTGEIQHDVFDHVNGIKYDLQRAPDGVIDYADIYTIDKNGDRVATIATKDENGWAVIEKNDIGYTMFHEDAIKHAKPATKEKMKAVQSQDWDALLQSWQDKIDLIKGK